MKKSVTFALLALTILFLVGCGNQETATSEATSTPDNTSNKTEVEETVTLSYGHYFTPEDFNGQLAQHWANLVNEKSNGTIKIEIYPNEQLVKGKEGFQSTASGTVDLYPVMSAYMAGAIPLASIFDLPFPPESYTDEVVAEFAEEAGPILEEEMTKNNVKNLGAIGTSGSTALYFTEPTQSLEDLDERNQGVRGFN